ncbi:TRAP transporter large permease subunit [Paenirhodobacter enshiensis]|uniref:TRAP transporter large permease subunit n=1 Tax=Paenirhodobacter enshiensis TaxID=1105367 RepID=UPI0035B180D0
MTDAILGMLTPPVGNVLNVVAGVGNIGLDKVTRGVMPFLLMQIALLFVLVLVPDIILVPLHVLHPTP